MTKHIWVITYFNIFIHLVYLKFCNVCVTDISTSTEGIRIIDPQFEHPSAKPTELIGKFPLATASSSTLYQHCYMWIVLQQTVTIWTEATFVLH